MVDQCLHSLSLFLSLSRSLIIQSVVQFLERRTVAAARSARYSVASAWPAWVATALAHLVELRHLNSLPDSFEIDAYHASTATAAATSSSAALLFPQQNLTDLFEQRTVDGCSFVGLVTGRYGCISTAAATTTTERVTTAATSTRSAVAVAGRDWWFGQGEPC
ncbi:hypothetical protein WN51_04321 [Melipona quadrifasciata]|uniref:Uncharacterized protein n=1 Tax=Melipona quadrifasciata TaxID=166423 RepID=A0A0N0BCP7_9HYME|nr:hypothetical protein WN51_04321 [Melipona quadrifasciata]